MRELESRLIQEQGDMRIASMCLLDVIQGSEEIERGEHAWWERGYVVVVEIPRFEAS